jgi:hypothetical protein
VPAAFNYSSIASTYTQDFDSLASSGTDHEWTNDDTIKGWHLFRVTAGNNNAPFPMTLYDSSNGSAGDGRFYSFGRDTDRAIGAIGNGAFGYPGDRATSVLLNATSGWLAASFTNSTGVLLSQFTVAYDGEQWRDGGDNEPPYAQTMEFQYGFGPDFSSVSSWTSPGGNFNFISPVFTTSAGPIDGNSIGRVPNLGGTISSLDWQPGETLWLRWIERNDLGIDHGMAIDSFSFSAAPPAVTAVPEATTAVVFLVISVIVCLGSFRLDSSAG